ncbi:MAG: hypothetical protein Q4G43_15945, partial [Mobilicoccus sp.]|nr:hypothetical protein [Mobilicoccus sp.]
AVIALDLTDQLLYGLLYRELDDAALLGGAGAYSLVVQHLASWFTDQRKWVDALYAAWLADETHGSDNRVAFTEVLDRRFGQAVDAVRLLAAKVDDLVADAGAGDALDRVIEQVRAAYADQGLNTPEVAA